MADLLRRTELDAVVASRSQAANHSYFADEGEDFDDPYDPDDEQYPEEDYYEDDEYAAFAEGEGDESEDQEEDEAARDEDEDEYGSVTLGYLEARKKLMSLKKSRGFFKEPTGSGSKGSSKGTEHRDHHRDREPRDRPSPQDTCVRVTLVGEIAAAIGQAADLDQADAQVHRLRLEGTKAAARVSQKAVVAALQGSLAVGNLLVLNTLALPSRIP